MCHIVMGSDPQVSNCRNQPQCTALEGRQQRGWRQERTVTGKNKTEKIMLWGPREQEALRRVGAVSTTAERPRRMS